MRNRSNVIHTEEYCFRINSHKREATITCLLNVCKDLVAKMNYYINRYLIYIPRINREDIEYVFVIGDMMKEIRPYRIICGHRVEYSTNLLPGVILLEARRKDIFTFHPDAVDALSKAANYYYNNDIKAINELYKRMSENNMLRIRNVIFNNPATIVFWEDGTKSVVKCQDEKFDPEKGLAMAISRKALGNKGNYFDTFDKYINRYEKKKEN